MIEKKIEICIGTDRAQGVRARLSLLILDGADIINENFHSVTLLPGDDPAAARSAIEAHIGKTGGGVPGAPWPKIPDEEWAKVLRVLPIFHTPAAIAKRRQTRPT
jgi:hypothetical protein